MNEQSEDGGPEAPKPDQGNLPPAGLQSPEPQSAASEAPGAAGPIDELRERITGVANEFLKKTMGLRDGVDGSLHLPQAASFSNLGVRADEFVRGFFRGFVEKTPEERDAQAGLRDPKDVPSGTEVIARLLTRVNDTVSGSFHNYLKDHVVDAEKPAQPVVVDGRFVLRHGAPLLVSVVQALGQRFSDPKSLTEAAPEPPAASAEAAAPGPAPDPKDAPHVDYRVDLPSVFKSLFVRPPNDGGSR